MKIYLYLFDRFLLSTSQILIHSRWRYLSLLKLNAFFIMNGNQNVYINYNAKGNWKAIYRRKIKPPSTKRPHTEINHNRNIHCDGYRWSKIQRKKNIKKLRQILTYNMMLTRNPFIIILPPRTNETETHIYTEPFVFFSY